MLMIRKFLKAIELNFGYGDYTHAESHLKHDDHDDGHDDHDGRAHAIFSRRL